MSSEVLAPMVFVDLETTGAVAAIDRITEIGIVEIDAQGRHHVWSSLVNPEVPIPAFIQGLTGITDEMVADAPTFSELADEVWARLDGRLFVAHNARFDHGFLRQAFEREGRVFKPQVLCTVKLSRRMFPEQRRHSLDALVERHGLPRPARHRALADAQALAHYWQVLQSQCDPQTMHDAVAELTGRSQWPSHLPMDMMQALPEGHGVYVLYAQDGQALHVGKGRNVRQQVLRHFQSDRRAAAGKGHGHLVQRVEGHAASGEWGAALQEAALIARLHPTQHRSGREAVREPACTWLLAPDAATLSLTAADALTWAADEHAYGLFGSRREAMKQLREIAQDAQLCLVTLGVEDRRGLSGCEAHGRMLCSGACLGHEEAAGHFARAQRVLSAWRLPAWPHAGAIALQEGDVWHVVDRWRYLGAFSDMALDTVKDTAAWRDVEGAVLCRQTFKLVSAWLAQPDVLLRQLERVS